MAVTPAEVATTLLRPTPNSPEVVAAWDMWISDVYRQIRNRFKATYAQLDPEDVDYVVREAVAEKVRAFRDGDTATSETVNVDDGQLTRRWESKPVSRVAIAEELWDTLIPVESGAWTINPLGGC